MKVIIVCLLFLVGASVCKFINTDNLIKDCEKGTEQVLVLFTCGGGSLCNEKDEFCNLIKDADNTSEIYENWDTSDELYPDDILTDDLDAEFRKAVLHYRVRTRARPWFDAATACWRAGGRLAAPGDQSEARSLGRLLQVTTQVANITNADTIDAMHVGFHNLGLERSWHTTEGEPVTFGTWIDDLTFARHKEWVYRCGAVISDGRFVHENPSQKLIYACDMETRTHKKPPIQADGYKAVAGKHRYKLHPSPLAWAEALASCEGEGAALAAPDEGAEAAERLAEELLGRQGAAEARTGGGVFVGFNDLTDEGDWRDARGNYVIIDDIWAPGEPKGKRAANCAALTPMGKYIAVPCTELKSFLCEKKITEEESVEYVSVDGVGRFALHKRHNGWMGALMKCKSENASLAVPRSEEEALALDRLVADALGLPRERKTDFSTRDFSERSRGVAVGVHDIDGDGHWSTVEGVPLSKSEYNEWLKYDPSFHRGLMKCGGLSYGKYVHILCEAPHMYICQKPL